MIRGPILFGLLAALAACETYTDKTSPCFGRDGKPVVSRSGISPAFFASAAIARNAQDHDCVFKSIGAAE